MATGAYIAVGHNGAPYFTLLNHNSGSPTLSATYALSAYCDTVSYSPSGNHIAVGYDTPYFTLLNHNSGSPTLSGTYTLPNYCFAASYSPSGNHIAVGNYTTAPYFTLLNHNSGSPTLSGTYLLAGYAWAASYSPSGNHIAVGHSVTAPYFTLLNHNSGSPTLSATYALANYCFAASYSPSGNHIAVGRYGSSLCFNLLNHNSGSPTLSATYASATNNADSYSPSGAYITVGHNGAPYFTLLNHNSGSPTLSGSYTLPNSCFAASYSPSGNHIAVGNYTTAPRFTLLNHNSGSPTLSATYALPNTGRAVSYYNIIEVTTQAVSSIAATTATGNGTLVSSPAGYAITERGICYNTAGNPTTADTCVHDHTASTGAYTAALTGLSAGTAYHTKAYCIVAGATYYGAEVDFSTASVSPDVGNSPGTLSVGNLSAGGNYVTGLTYFTVVNNSAFAVNIIITGTDMTGGTTWTLADDGNPGSNIVGVKAGVEGGDYTIIVKKTSGNTLTSNLAAAASKRWGWKMFAPTSFSDYVAKSGTITLTAIAY